MKINQIIKQKRSEAGLTQEQVANCLGVSSPAVNKWENAVSYPDITILPALARLLKTDLNTLLSFNDDLTKLEVGQIANEISDIISKQDFETGYNAAMEKIHEYPNCDLLIYTLATVLEGGLFIFAPQSREQYAPEIDSLYERVVNSNDAEVRSPALTMLISKYITKNELEKAQQLLNTVPDHKFNKSQMQAIVYARQNYMEKALELTEKNLLSSANDVCSALLHLVDMAIKEKRFDQAEHFSHIYVKTVELYDMWDYSKYVAPFQLACAKKDGDKAIELFESLLKGIDTQWKINDSPLYKHIPTKSRDTEFPNKIKSSMLAEIQTDKSSEFLKSHPKFQKLMEQYGNSPVG